MLAKTADRARGRFALSGVLLWALLSLPLQTLSAAVSISDISGTARVRRPNVASWNEVPVNYVLSAGDEVKTDRSSRVTITFDDSSRVEIGPNSSYLLEETQAASSRMSLNFGRLKAWVTKASSRRFAVRTPTAVCSVRGTEFGVDVGQDGRTSVELIAGQLGVQDNKGNEVLLNPGERIDVSLTGLGKKENAETKKAEESSSERAEVKKEVGLEMSKEQVLAAAAEELKQAEYQAGKALIDVHGNRVRVESYIMRPAADTFKLVVLNEREARFDYLYMLATFGETLPADLSLATRDMKGCFGTCAFHLTRKDLGMSSTQDFFRFVETYTNAVNTVGDADRPKFLVGLDGEYRTVTAADTVSFPRLATQAITVTGAVDYSGLAKSNTSCTDGPAADCGWTDPKALHESAFFGSSNSKWYQFENFIITDEGKVVPRSDFAGITGNAEFKNALSKINYELVVTAAAFSGRKIDLVIDPRILISSGLIP